MGRVVAVSPAADPKSAWGCATPAQQLINSCALGVTPPQRDNSDLFGGA